ncbi:MAG: NAD(P)-binding protein [Oscillospiraceae bacterium]|nr:NAD(P)-binding protein [Oscillospiraceae bacterium]
MKYLILGAGPAGLTFANKLKEMGETSFLVLEHEEEAGGLCRSAEVDGSPFDIGGGHFLDVRIPEVTKFLFGFMPESEWNKFDRDSRIVVGNNTIHHPMEANIWEMDIDSQVEYLKSIAAAGCNSGAKMPKDFVEWIFWKLGDKIAEDYMIPYNRKMFADDLNDLGTYWLDKLPSVSFEDTLRSCLTKHAYAKQPGHAQFYYPKKYGYGEVWKRMADNISGNIEYGKTAVKLNITEKSVTAKDGSVYQAENIITTIPWLEFEEIIGMPDDIRSMIKKLKYSSVETRYYSENMDTDAHWIYYPNDNLAYHRILVRHNFSLGSRGYWTETRKERISMITDDNFNYLNKYAYPLNTKEKPEIMKSVLEFGRENNIYGLGRWGEHQHYNSDITVNLSMKLAQQLNG